MCKNGIVFCMHSTGPSNFLPRLCVLYMCMHTLFACVWRCASYTSVYKHVEPAINARDHSQFLFHRIHWGRGLQSDPELKVISSPASQLALGIFCLCLLSAGIMSVLPCLPGIYGGLVHLNSSHQDCMQMLCPLSHHYSSRIFINGMLESTDLSHWAF